MGTKKNNSLVESWYTKFNTQLTLFLGKAVSTQADLKDLSQEVYLRMLRVKNPQMIRSPRAYLYKVAIHVIDEWRSSSRKKHIHISDGFEKEIEKETGYGSLYEEQQTSILNHKIELDNALKSLPKIYATTLIMKWHYGKSYKEISKDLNITQRQVKRYIVKGYSALRIILAKSSEQNNDQN